jgi:hypothetical protein
MGRKRTGIFDITGQGRTRSLSRRGINGKLSIVFRKCHNCNHHKAFSSVSGILKCCRCKTKLNSK